MWPASDRTADTTALDRAPRARPAGASVAVTRLPDLRHLTACLDNQGDARPAGGHVAVVIELATAGSVAAFARASSREAMQDLVGAAAEFVAGMMAPGHRLYQLGPLRFAFVTPAGDVTGLQAIDRVVTRLHHPLFGADPPLTASPAVGIARFMPGTLRAADLLERALTLALAARATGSVAADCDLTQASALPCAPATVSDRYRRRHTSVEETA